MLEKLTAELRGKPFTMIVMLCVSIMTITTAKNSTSLDQSQRIAYLASSTARASLSNEWQIKISVIDARQDLIRHELAVLSLWESSTGEDPYLTQRRKGLLENLARTEQVRAKLIEERDLEFQDLERTISTLGQPLKDYSPLESIL